MTEHDAITMLPADGLHGRRKILTDKRAVTAQNVAEIVGSAYSAHLRNRREIQYLYDVYRGKQDIRHKQKSYREEINNRVSVNRANEIVTFKVSYLLSEPLMFVSRESGAEVSDDIARLNGYMYAEDKLAKDKEIADWMHICGVGCRFVMPTPAGHPSESPFLIYSLDPRDTFVVYQGGFAKQPLAGVLVERDEDGRQFFTVYAKNVKYEVRGDVVTAEPHTLPYIPVIEYVHNEARMGAFEVVLPLLNAINTLESNRVDDVQQFVDSILVFENCEIDAEKAEAIIRNLGLQIKSDPQNPAKVYRVAGELSQSGAQTLVDDLYDSVLTITGMPNRNGGSSTSDTGAATIMRDGWEAAEARAKDTEKLWNRAEREFLRIALDICATREGMTLALRDIDVKFTRRSYSNIQSKAQVLAEMLNNDKIHPKYAFTTCGLFTDPEEAYRVSMEYYEDRQAALQRTLAEELNGTVHTHGQDDGAVEPQSGAAVRDRENESGTA